MGPCSVCEGTLKQTGAEQWVCDDCGAEYTFPADKQSMQDLLARSSLGTTAWCGNCNHPDLVHDKSGCTTVVGIEEIYTATCSCTGFTKMTEREWRRLHGRQQMGRR